MPGAAARPVLLDLVSVSPTPLALDTLKRERLQELRAAIDALREEQTARDPLLAWAIAQQNRVSVQPD
jgi:hypothetical protein